MNFAEKLRVTMALKSIKPGGLAKSTGIHVNSIYRYCSGETTPDIYTVARLEVALGVEKGTLTPDLDEEEERQAS